MNYKNILENSYNGVSGVTVVDSGKPGKNIGVGAITHGNEVVGLQIFDYLLGKFDLKSNLKSGKVFLIAMNIEAYKVFESSENHSAGRFIDENMNRIANQSFDSSKSEHRRLKELIPILDELDVLLDIHSVPKGNDLLGIVDKKTLEIAKEFMDVESYMVEEDMGRSGAVIGYLSRQGKFAVGLEAGNHLISDGFDNGIRNSLNYLKYFGAIEGEIVQEKKCEGAFKFHKELKVTTDEFRYCIEFDDKFFHKLSYGELIAKDGDREIVQDIQGKDMYIGLVCKTFRKGDGAGFLFEKIG